MKDWWNDRINQKEKKAGDQIDNVFGTVGANSNVRIRGMRSAPAPHPNLRRGEGERRAPQHMRLPQSSTGNSSTRFNARVSASAGRPDNTVVGYFRDGDQMYDTVAVYNLEGQVSSFEVRMTVPESAGNTEHRPVRGVRSDVLTNRNQKVLSEIQLNYWKSNAGYLKIFDSIPANKYFEKYLELKKDFQNQPAFFIDVARFFNAKNNKQLALQVLSNVTEMKLENAELLRIVANELLEVGEIELAIETFKQVLKMREEEPQSYRNLALAYNEAGKHNEAVELLYKVVTGTWDARFANGLKSIALNEMNAIISAHPEAKTSAIDTTFLAAMPVDVRIVIGWSSDNSDVDLWVTEPNKEKCYYKNQLTKKGGRISGDITQGYGPEEYMIKKADDGTYIIEANLYGDRRQDIGGQITVKAELFTNFGRPTQKRKVINFRVTTNKEVVKIGELKFAKSDN